MHRRLAALVGTLAFALLVPLSIVSADTVFEPTGSYVYVASERVCNTSLCTVAQLSYGRTADGDYACLTLQHSDVEFGVIYETESGCGDPSTVFGAFVFSKGFLVGIGSTTLNLTSDLTFTSRDVTFSGSFAATGRPVSSTNSYDVIDYPEEGCTTTYTARQKLVFLTGTLTISGDTFALVEGDSRNVQARLSKPSC